MLNTNQIYLLEYMQRIYGYHNFYNNYGEYNSKTWYNLKSNNFIIEIKLHHKTFVKLKVSYSHKNMRFSNGEYSVNIKSNKRPNAKDILRISKLFNKSVEFDKKNILNPNLIESNIKKDLGLDVSVVVYDSIENPIMIEITTKYGVFRYSPYEYCDDLDSYTKEIDKFMEYMNKYIEVLENKGILSWS